MSVDVDELHDGVVRRLAGAGRRHTSGRRPVVAALVSADGPATISELVDLDVQLAQSSVYRNLAVLEEVGAVTRVVAHDDRVRFELAEALTHHPHHHLICGNCGVVGDFELAADAESALRGALARIGRSTRFRMDLRRLDLLGTCAACP